MKEQDQTPIRIIDRPRLLNQLEQTEARTILLIAPAGYGKTTLLRQWAQRNDPHCWYTAGTGSSDLAELATGLAAALEAVCPGVREHVAQVAAALSNPARESPEFVELFAAHLKDVSPVTVLIDDYHLLAGSAGAECFLHQLFDRLNLRLLVGSRLRPSWATARQSIYGELLELGPESLALTEDEIAAVLVDAPGTPSETFLKQADGWPAVIGLAALAKSSRRTPDNVVSSTLFRFFAEELFDAAPVSLQESLLTMALMPALSPELMGAEFGKSAASVLAEAVRHGFVTVSDSQDDLHPLIREYLLWRFSRQTDCDPQVEDAVMSCLRHEAWDYAFALITRFCRVDLLDRFLESAFIPLTRSGRVGTLEQVRDFARSRSVDFSPTVLLIDAELALRDGLFKRAEALGTRAAEALGSGHVLAARAHWVAGQGAQLTPNYSAASQHFKHAHSAAKDDGDTRDALWGLMLTSIYSEAFAANEIAEALQRRRDASPIDLLLATNATMLVRRYSIGFAATLDAESAIHSLDAVRDPRVRTSFTYNLSYERLLCADYEGAQRAAELTLAQASSYQLSWVVPTAEWVLAAASLGRRDFARADRWLRRVERAGETFDIPHIGLNAAALRARFHLALHRPEQAHNVVMVDDDRPVVPAMRAELCAMRALACALQGDLKNAELASEQAAAMTNALEVHAYVACAHAISRPVEKNAARAFEMAKRFEIWDPLISTMRASQPLVERLAAKPARRTQLQRLLRQSNDFDLARRAGVPVGARPRTSQSPLTRRELEVLELVRQGLTNKQIGEILFISQGTAKVHVRHILDKTGCRSRTEAATRFPLDPT